MPRDELVLIYDQGCPVCQHYCQIIRIREDLGELRIVDARQESQFREKASQLGLDLDTGMVLKLGERWYHGADAIHALSLLSSRSGWFNKLNYWCFKSRTLSRLLYPVMLSGRLLLLRLLGRNKINNL